MQNITCFTFITCLLCMVRTMQSTASATAVSSPVEPSQSSTLTTPGTSFLSAGTEYTTKSIANLNGTQILSPQAKDPNPPGTGIIEQLVAMAIAFGASFSFTLIILAICVIFYRRRFRKRSNKYSGKIFGRIYGSSNSLNGVGTGVQSTRFLVVPRNTERTKTTVHTGTALAATETKSMDTTLFQTRLQVLAVPGSYQVPWFGSVNEVEQVFANRNTLVTRGDPINAELISRSDGRQVVVKRLNIASELAHEALYQELSIMYMFVDNDLFVKLVGYTERPYYAIMTVYYPLGSLNNALYKNRVIPSTRRIIVQFAREVSQAVEFMHSNGFAHCDLKPHNVFVDQLLPMYADRLAVYQCKLADFGLVQVLDERHSYVKAYDFMSMRGLTISYAAPETIQRFRKYIKMEPKDIRYTAGDVYSLSMMLFELVESRLAWHKAKVVNQ